MKQPLAYRIRPTHVDEIIGQSHLFNEDGIVRKMIEQQALQSMIFFGPPGCGKTSTAITIANLLNRPFRLFNAVTGNKKDLDTIYLEAKMADGLILIMDEVHRMNKDKQDTLLPHLEDGLITLIGTTTANPYYAINPAIRSRAFLIEFFPLHEQEIEQILLRALNHPQGFNGQFEIEAKALNFLSQSANGDARFALNLLQLATINTKQDQLIALTAVEKLVPKFALTYAKDGEEYYNNLSGLQKSIRGSDVNGALYYLAILILANDLVSLERRLLVIAYEDIGLANPQLCARAVNALESAKRVGFPEARIILSHLVIELALSPKSKSAIQAIDQALTTVSKQNYAMPTYLKLTPVGLGEDELYDYARPDLWLKYQYLPDALKGVEFYRPQNLHSAEKTLAENYEKLRQLKRTSAIGKLKK